MNFRNAAVILTTAFIFGYNKDTLKINETENSMRRKEALPELLSPAGDFECLVAAVKGGADAIYVGGRSFGARAYAKNFDLCRKNC